MATFHVNPNDENEPFLESRAIEGLDFRVWHIMFFAFFGVGALFVFICCCVKFRIPRTKQEIEGDYHRKKLAEKFQERLKAIQQSKTMDAIDLQTALRIIQEDFDNEKKLLQEKVTLGIYTEKDENLDEGQRSPLFINIDSQQRPRNKFANIMLATTIRSPQ